MSGTTARGLAYRREKRQKARKRLLGMAGYMAYPRSVYVIRNFENGRWTFEKTPKRRKNSKVEGYHKRRSEKAVRRAQNLPPRGNSYRRLYDYWWSID